MKCPLIPTAAALLACAAPAPGQEAPAHGAPVQKKVETASPGPWGELEYYEVPLICPEENLALFNMPSQLTEWFVPAQGEAEIKSRLVNADMTAEEAGLLLGESHFITDEEGTRIFPPESVVFGIDLDLRIRLYRFLAGFERNRFHRRPLYINNPNLSVWFQGSGLPRSVIEDVAELAYPTPSGKGYFLADFPILLRRAETAVEERLLVQALLRQPTLLLRMRLREDADAPAIANFWSSEFRNKDVLPLIESVIRIPEVERLDVTHLLPSTPRKHANTFPSRHDAAGGRYPDWFWTCYNFTRFVPRDVYADSEARDFLLATEYTQALPPHMFGDIILIHLGGRIVHGSVYIADDIVYTKNSPDPFTPWLLMKIEDVVAYHDLRGDASLTIHRKLPPKN